MTYEKLLEKFRELKNPEDYFQGYGEPYFSPPRNILMFYRDTVSATELQLYTDFHYRNVLVMNTGVPIRMQLDSKHIYLDHHCYILILPYQYHRFIIEQEKGLSLTLITFEMTDNLYWETFRYMARQFDSGSIKLLESCYTAFTENRTMELPFQVGALMANLAGQKRIIEDDLYKKMKSSQLVGDLCRRIYKNKSLNIKELSCEVGYSESYLRKSFRKVMGIALGQYMIEVRLTDAMFYLSTSDKSITEIAELVGYENVFSLSRAFKVHIGLSPTAYRLERKRHFKSQEIYRFRNKKGHFMEAERHNSSEFHFF